MSFGKGVELNPIIGERIRRRKKKEYHHRLKHISHAIDASLPRGYSNVKGTGVKRRVDLKKRLTEKVEARYRKRENDILEERMGAMSKSLVDHRLEEKYRHFSTINGPARKKFQKWLKTDNYHFKRRLKETPATYQRKIWREWRNKTKGAILANPYTARRVNRQAEIDADNSVNSKRVESTPANYHLDKYNEQYLVQKELREVNPYTVKRKKVYKEIAFDNKVCQVRLAKTTAGLTPRKWGKDRKCLRHTEKTNPYTLKRKNDAKLLDVDNHHFYRRINDQGPYYVVGDWLKQREEMEKKIIYMCTLTSGRKGWTVAPLVPRNNERSSPRASDAEIANIVMSATTSPSRDMHKALTEELASPSPSSEFIPHPPASPSSFRNRTQDVPMRSPRTGKILLQGSACC
jgi:hypothetical protein|eukprot:g6112.t1